MSNVDCTILDAIDRLDTAADALMYVLASRNSEDDRGESAVIGMVLSKVTEALELLNAIRQAQQKPA